MKEIRQQVTFHAYHVARNVYSMQNDFLGLKDFMSESWFKWDSVFTTSEVRSLRPFCYYYWLQEIRKCEIGGDP